MSFFVPVSTAFEDGINAPRTAVRSVKLLIDGDGDGTYADYTSYVDFGAGGITGGGKRGGRMGKAMSNAWSVALRNQHLGLSAGDLAEAPAAIEVDVDGVGYVRIFTGYIDASGASRVIGYGSDDTVKLSLVDAFARSATKRKVDPAIYTGYQICDTSNTSQSLLHILAAQIGYAPAGVVVSDIPYTVDYVAHEKQKVMAELQKLAQQYIGLLTVRYDGKLLFSSRFESGYSAPVHEWTFDDDNVHKISKAYERPVDATRVYCEYIEWQKLAQQVIYKNVENYNAATDQIDIDVAAGEYWPGGTRANDVAKLGFVDPETGEKWAAGVEVQTPTIGAVGSGADIECDGGLLTLVSFNGSTTGTEQHQDAAEIILKNETAGTIKIRRLEIRGKPLRKLKARTIEEINSSITDAEEHRDIQIDGTYAATQSQCATTTLWRYEWGNVRRKIYELDVEWTPHLQEGALVRFQLDRKGIPLGDYYVDEYQHVMKGTYPTWHTRLKLVEKETFSGGEASGETVDDLADRAASTHDQLVNLVNTYDQTSGLDGGTPDSRSGDAVDGGTPTPRTSNRRIASGGPHVTGENVRHEVDRISDEIAAAIGHSSFDEMKTKLDGRPIIFLNQDPDKGALGAALINFDLVDTQALLAYLVEADAIKSTNYEDGVNGSFLNLQTGEFKLYDDSTGIVRSLEIGPNGGLLAEDSNGNVFHDIPTDNLEATHRYSGHVIWFDDDPQYLIYSATITSSGWYEIQAITGGFTNARAGVFKISLNEQHSAATPTMWAKAALRPKGSSYGIGGGAATPEYGFYIQLANDECWSGIHESMLICPLGSDNKVEAYLTAGYLSSVGSLGVNIAQLGVLV